MVGALAATSVLTRDVVTAALDALRRRDARPPSSTASDLADEVELVKLAPATLSLEEMSKLWGVLDTPYLLSLTYLATVVLIAADVTPTVALPVRQRSLTVGPAVPATARLGRDRPAGEPVGSRLDARRARQPARRPGAAVRVGPRGARPRSPAVPTAELRAVLDDDVPAGVHALQVVAALGRRTRRRAAGAASSATSNALPLLVRPAVAVAGVDATEVTLAVSPAAAGGPAASRSMLARLEGGAAGDPTAVTLVLPPVAAGEAPLAHASSCRATRSPTAAGSCACRSTASTACPSSSARPTARPT